MLDDDMIDSFLNEQYLPGVRNVTVSNANGSVLVPLEARCEDVTDDNVMKLGIGNIAVGQRLYFIWINQDGYIPVRPAWSVADEKDGSTWKVDSVQNGIQQREIVCTCTRSRTSTVGT